MKEITHTKERRVRVYPEPGGVLIEESTAWLPTGNVKRRFDHTRIFLTLEELNAIKRNATAEKGKK